MHVQLSRNAYKISLLFVNSLLFQLRNINNSYMRIRAVVWSRLIRFYLTDSIKNLQNYKKKFAVYIPR